jgi:hypothetical protein
MLRALLRSVWIADVVASIVLGLTLYFLYGNSLVQEIAAVSFFGSGLYLFFWLLRRFGFLAYLASTQTFSFFVAVPVSLKSWYALDGILPRLIPVGIALWAVWVIHSTYRRPAIDA